MNGWIKLHKKFLEWGWYKEPFMVQLFIHLLLLANFEDKEWKGINIKRGQVITGRYSLSENTGISAQSIRTCLKKLKSTSEITIKSTNKYSIITIVKYNDYQNNEIKSTSKSTSKSTNDQPAINQQSTTTKEYKNIRNKEYIVQPSAVSQIKKLTPIQEIVEYFFKVKGWESKEQTFSRYVREAKDIYDLAGQDISVVKNKITKVSSWADSKGLSWNLGTVLKRWQEKEPLEKELDEAELISQKIKQLNKEDGTRN